MMMMMIIIISIIIIAFFVGSGKKKDLILCFLLSCTICKEMLACKILMINTPAGNICPVDQRTASSRRESFERIQLQRT